MYKHIQMLLKSITAVFLIRKTFVLWLFFEIEYYNFEYLYSKKRDDKYTLRVNIKKL